jgi:hypothetical protein
MDFTYKDLEIPNSNFRISPSSIGKFFDYPSIWYKEHILKEKPEFNGNTASVLGTVIHAIAEEYGRYGSTPPNARELCNNYINSFKNNEDVDCDLVKNLYEGMATILINDYLRYNIPNKVEEQVFTEVKNGIYVGGSCDALHGRTTITDYKNVGKKPSIDSIPFNYKIQLLSYALCYKNMGYPIDRIQIIYTVRPTKTLSPRVFQVAHTIQDEDWKLINDTLELIADSVELVKKNQSLAYIVFKSMNLKEKN